MEKRRVERFNMRMPATIFVEGVLQEVLNLETADISSRGTFLTTGKALPQGAHVEVELTLPMAKVLKLVGPESTVKVTVNGTVVRRDGKGIAIEFDRDYRISAI